MATIAVLAGEHRPLGNAFAMLCGWTLLLIVLAGFILLLFGGSGPALSNSTKAAFNVVIGLLLVSFESEPHRRTTPAGACGRRDERQAPAVPHWLRSLDSLTMVKAFGVGAVILAVSPADLAVYVADGWSPISAS
jgi:hypothetical protein